MIELLGGKYVIGKDQPPFVIAELSGNHNQSLDRALAMVNMAAEAGAHAIKLQTYTADTMTIDHRGGLFEIDDPSSLWKGRNLYELYEEAHTPWIWHREIFDRAHSLGLVAFSTPFDETAVDFLEELEAPIYKIASFESDHWPLLKKVAATRKPVIISSGASRLNDLYESVDILRKGGCPQIIILKCTSTYPAEPGKSNLATIPVLKEIFPDCIIGLSDHTLGIGVSIASVALGARVIEKHITLQRSDGGVDSAFSLEPEELQSLVTETGLAFQSLGHVQLDSQKVEFKSLRFKRSIYVVKDISKGEVFTRENIRIIRPGDGLRPKYYEQFLGMKSNVALKRGTPLSWH